jgi:hypothetical protein
MYLFGEGADETSKVEYSGAREDDVFFLLKKKYN